jgi:hypothetical protein
MNLDDDLSTQTGVPNSLKPLMVFAAVLIITVLAGVVVGYLLGSRIRQGIPSIPWRQSVHVPAITQLSATGIISEQALSNITKKQFNPSGTLAFYFTSQTPAFAPNDDAQNRYLITDDPFEVCFNGDTFYVIPSPQYPDLTDKYIITPHIVETDNLKSYTLSFIGEVKAPNGCVRITHWVDDSHLLREACGGDQSVSCECHIIDVWQRSSKDLSPAECPVYAHYRH